MGANKLLRLFITAHFILLYYLPIFSQSDTLLTSQNRNYFAQLDDSLRKYIHSDINKSENFARKSLEIASLINDDHWRAKANLRMMNVYVFKGNNNGMTEAIKLGEEGLRFAEEAGDSLLVARINLMLAQSSDRLQNYSEALKYINRSIKVSKAINDLGELSKAYIEQATTYARLKLYNKALEGYEASYALTQDSSFNERGTILYNQAIILHQHLNDRDEAYLKYEKAYESFILSNHVLGMHAINIALGALFLDDEKYLLAKKYFDKAQELNNDYESIPFSIGIKQWLSKYYMRTGITDSAIYYIDEALRLSAEHGKLIHRISSLRFKADIMSAIGDSTEALQLTAKAFFLSDSLQIIQAKGINEVIEKQTVQNKQRISSYENILSKNNFAMWAVILLAILITGICIAVFFKYKTVRKSVTMEKVEKEQLQRKLASNTATLAAQQDLLSGVEVLLTKLGRQHDLGGISDRVNETKQQIKDTKNLADAWKSFFIQFEQVHPHFFEQLTSSYKLSQQDLKLCAFIKMNLSRKELAEVLHIHRDSLNVTLHRLKKKLALPRDASLHSFLQNLDQEINKLKKK